MRDLNRLYREAPALHVHDAEPAGFEWIDANDADNSAYAYVRHSAVRLIRPVVVVCNFTPVVREATTASACRAPAAGSSA